MNMEKLTLKMRMTSEDIGLIETLISFRRIELTLRLNHPEHYSDYSIDLMKNELTELDGFEQMVEHEYRYALTEAIEESLK